MDKRINFSLDIPEGFEIDNAAKEKLLESFKQLSREAIKPIDKQLPKTWSEVGVINGCKVNNYGNVTIVNTDASSSYSNGMYPSKKLCEASIALAKLLYLRDIYNDGWIPVWTNDHEDKYTIYNISQFAWYSW